MPFLLDFEVPKQILMYWISLSISDNWVPISFWCLFYISSFQINPKIMLISQLIVFIFKMKNKNKILFNVDGGIQIPQGFLSLQCMEDKEWFAFESINMEMGLKISVKKFNYNKEIDWFI
jgi:hypothetical protein